jgi:ribosomal protein S18 acetylase RimI-like enzyme
MPTTSVVVQHSARWLPACRTFSCGDADLDSFLSDDSLRLQNEHVARTFLSVARTDGRILGYVTVLNDAVHLLTREKKKLGLASDDHPVVPALKIARLGVASEYARSGLGTALVRHAYFSAQRSDASGGCRLLTVDAYRQAVSFYERLGFQRNRSPEYRDRENPSLRLDVFAPELPDWI